MMKHRWLLFSCLNIKYLWFSWEKWFLIGSPKLSQHWNGILCINFFAPAANLAESEMSNFADWWATLLHTNSALKLLLVYQNKEIIAATNTYKI